MITTFIKRALGLWMLVLLPALSYAGAPSGHYENHFDQQPGVWDFSGTYSGTDDEGSFDQTFVFTIVHDDKGKISGQGTRTGIYDDDYDFELHTTVSGSIKTIGNITRGDLKEKGVGTATNGYQFWKVKGETKQTLYIDEIDGLLIGPRKGKICAQGEGCLPINDVAFIDIPDGEDGTWDLVLDIQNVNGKTLTGTASAILARGRIVPFALKGKYNANTDLTKLSLKGGGGNFTIQANVVANQLVFQTIKGKMLGQTVNQ